MPERGLAIGIADDPRWLREHTPSMGDGGKAPRPLMIRGLGLCPMANAEGNEPEVLMPAT